MSETSYEQNLRLRDEEQKAPRKAKDHKHEGLTSLEQPAVLNKVPK